MRRPAKTAGATKPTRSTPVTATGATKAGTAGRTGSAASARVSAAAAPASKPSKDELRAQVEKLERANATLRAKNRESGRIAKTAAARIAELEDQVAQFEKKLSRPASAARGRKPVDRTGPRHREIDPGDAVPPGVAVQEPAPLDEEAETARDNLEEHLGHSPD